MSATRYGGMKVNDVLVTSNIPAKRESGGCRSIRRLPSPAPRHRLRGFGNDAILEIKKPWTSRSFGNFHQQPFGLGILDAVHKAAALVHVTHGLGQGDAGLNEHHDAHREVALDPEINGEKVDADRDQEGRGAERTVGKGDPGVAVMLNVLIHGAP